MLQKIVFLLWISCLSYSNIIAQVKSKGGDVSNTSNPDTKGNTYALIVGVSNYQFPETYKTLDYADDDGRSFYAYLTSNAGGNISKENIDTLFNEQATHGAILEKLLSIKDRLQANDVLYFYFSGHGDAYNAEKAFLLAYDSPSSKGKKEKNHYLTLSGAIDIHTIKTIFKEISSTNATVVFISDACRTNELAGGLEGQGAIFKKIMEEDAGELRMSSCSSNQVSFEGPQWGKGRGLFSYHLINGLTGMADTDPEDSKVTVDELFTYVKLQVKRETYDTVQGISLQTPQYSCRRENCEDMVINKVNKSEKDRLALALKNETNYNNTLYAYKSPKGLDLYTEMKSIGREEYFAAFSAAVNKKLYIGENSAYEIFKKIEADPAISPKIVNEFRGSLSNILLTDVNRVINIYMNAAQNNNLYTHEMFYNTFLELKAFKEIANPLFYNATDVQMMLYFLEGHSNWKSHKTHELLYSLAKIDSAVALNPEASYLYNIKGLLHLKLKQFQKCEETFRKGISLAPNWVYPLHNMGHYYNTIGQHDSSLVYFFKALQLDSTNQPTYVGLAIEYSLIGKEDSSFYYLHKGLEIDPKDPWLWTYLGNKYYELEEWDNAMAAFRKSYTSDSTLTIGYEGAMRLHMKNYVSIDSVMLYLNKMIETDPEDPAVYLNVGYMLMDFDYDSIALSYFEASTLMDTLNVDGWNALAYVYKNLGDYETAEKAYYKSISIDSLYAFTYSQLGNLYYQTDRMEEARNALYWAIELNPYQEVYYYNLGFILMEEGKLDEAEVYFLLCSEKNRYYTYVYPEFARLYALKGNKARSLHYLEKSIQAKYYQSKEAVLEEEDFKSLVKDKAFKKLIKKYF